MGAFTTFSIIVGLDPDFLELFSDTLRVIRCQLVPGNAMKKDQDGEDSISGSSAAYFITKDDSLATLLKHHDIEIRDFMVLSFLSDQGAMSILYLSRTLSIEPTTILSCVKRLRDAELLVASNEDAFDTETVVEPSANGLEVANRILGQL